MARTVPLVERTTDDADGFIDAVERIVSGLIFRYRPPLVCTVRIKRWFDHRWLSFSGKGRIAVEPPWPSHQGVALDGIRQDQLTFPPFTPSRVASEKHWHRDGEGNYAVGDGAFVIHRGEREHSNTNLQRRLNELTDSALFVWFSSTSAKDRRASVMVYIVNEGVTIPWFAGMADGLDGWRLAEVQGIGRAEVAELLDHPPGVRPMPTL